jgi:Glycosyl hydrolases family 16
MVVGRFSNASRLERFKCGRNPVFDTPVQDQWRLTMDFPANPKEKPGYHLEFADEFSGTTLDRTKWFPHMLPHWSDLATSAARFEVGDGTLKLLIAQDQEPWIAGGDRASNLQTGQFSGPKGSEVGQFRYDPKFVVTEGIEDVQTYTPQFGYFETRIKAVPVVGYHVALWMIGFDATQAGEIRVFEIHGGRITTETSRIDYGLLRWNDPELQEECFEDHLPINAAEYHIYAVEWTPNRIDFFVDNAMVRTIHQSPQYPMQFMLGVYERPHEILEPHQGLPRVCEVDYVRGYQPVDGYDLN